MHAGAANASPAWPVSLPGRGVTRAAPTRDPGVAPAPGAPLPPARVPIRTGSHARGTRFSSRMAPCRGRIWQLNSRRRSNPEAHRRSSPPRREWRRCSGEVLPDLGVAPPPWSRLLDRRAALLAAAHHPSGAKCESGGIDPIEFGQTDPLLGIALQICAQVSGSEIVGLRCVVAVLRRLSSIATSRVNYCDFGSIGHLRAPRLTARAAIRSQYRFIARSISRLSSAARLAARLSCCFLWVTSASSTLTRAPLK